MFTPWAGHYSAIENCVPLGLLFCYPTVFYITFPYSIPFSYLSSYVLPTVFCATISLQYSSCLSYFSITISLLYVLPNFSMLQYYLS